MSILTSLSSNARAHGVLDRSEWFVRPKTDLLSGLVVALVLAAIAIGFFSAFRLPRRGL